MTKKMYEGAVEIVKVLQEAGHEALFSGGCVRDLLLDVEPNDYDIATSATPTDVENLFPDTLPIGKAFGVIQVRKYSYSFEVATFREEDGYIDGRRPTTIQYSTKLADSHRRDFTINAMYQDPITGTLFDYHGGKKDLEAKVLRFVGNARDRIREDKLRMMRALRFSVTLGFMIEPSQFEAIKELAPLVTTTSQERIQSEFVKMFKRNPHWSLHLLYASGILKMILPEIYFLKNIDQSPNYHPEGCVLNHTYNALMSAGGFPLDVKMAILLHDVGKSLTMSVGDDGMIHFYGHHEAGALIAERILQRLKFTRKFTDKVVWLVKNHMQPHFAPNMRKSKLKKLLASKWINELIRVHYSDCRGSRCNLETLEFIEKARESFTSDEISPAKLINGNDLKTLGIRPGPIYKEILKYIETLHLENGISSREEAIQKVREKYAKDSDC